MLKIIIGESISITSETRDNNAILCKFSNLKMFLPNSFFDLIVPFLILPLDQVFRNLPKMEIATRLFKAKRHKTWLMEKICWFFFVDYDENVTGKIDCSSHFE